MRCACSSTCHGPRPQGTLSLGVLLALSTCIVPSWRRVGLFAVLLWGVVLGMAACLYTWIPQMLLTNGEQGHMLRLTLIPLAVLPFAASSPFVLKETRHLLYSKPFLACIVFFSTAAGCGALLTGVVFRIFYASSDLERVAIRVFLLPILGEVAQAVGRFVFSHWGADSLPASFVTYLLGPITFTIAVTGRIFTSALSSVGATVMLAVAVSVVEVVMRLTVIPRDDAYRWCAARLPCCSMAPRDGSTKAVVQRRREMIGYFHFLSVDTLAEDVAILLVLPMAAFFRSPLFAGGPPVSLSDTLLRVALQWLLELATDATPFLLYACLRTLGSGCVPYVPVSHMELRQQRSISVVKEQGSAKGQIGHEGLTRSAAFIDDAEGEADQNPLAGYGAGTPMHSLPSPAGAIAGAAEDFPLEHESLQGMASPSPQSAGAETDPATAHVRAVQAAIQLHHEAAAQGEGAGVWDRLELSSLRAAMGISTAYWQSMGATRRMLWWLTATSDSMAGRVAAAWDQRDSKWALVTAGWIVSLGLFIVHELYYAGTHCIYTDPAGAPYADLCEL